MGLEGLVSKHRDSPYHGGRFDRWVKMKNQQHAAFNRVMDDSASRAAIAQLNSLRPIAVELNPDHDHRAGCNATEQITGHSSRTATMAARLPRFLICAKPQPATPIRNLRLTPAVGRLVAMRYSRAIRQFGCYPRIMMMDRAHPAFSRQKASFLYDLDPCQACHQPGDYRDC